MLFQAFGESSFLRESSVLTSHLSYEVGYRESLDFPPCLDPVPWVEKVMDRQIARAKLTIIAFTGFQPVILLGQRLSCGAEILVIS